MVNRLTSHFKSMNCKQIENSINILDLFQSKEIVKICAPMVRYSKLQFRNLVKEYGCDLCYTPMILADSFCLSSQARNNEFTTNLYDTPLITQFAANTVHDFVGAAYLSAPFCNGADLNCGCPQRWAKQLGLGCTMLEKPEMFYDIVRQCRNQIAKPFTVSVKMRILKDLKKSIEICKQLEKCGVSFVTVHGRTSSQITGDINKEALKLITESIGVPVVANGAVRNLEDCYELKNTTNCKGVMVANGLLTNPTLFTGSPTTTIECIQKWLDICYNSTIAQQNNTEITQIPEKPNNLTFQCFHHHLVFMLEKILDRKEKRVFNNLQSFCAVLEFIKYKFNLTPTPFRGNQFSERIVLDLDYSNRDEIYKKLKPVNSTEDLSSNFNLFYSCDESDGKYFASKTLKDDNDDVGCDWSSIFVENG